MAAIVDAVAADKVTTAEHAAKERLSGVENDVTVTAAKACSSALNRYRPFSGCDGPGAAIGASADESRADGRASSVLSVGDLTCAPPKPRAAESENGAKAYQLDGPNHFRAISPGTPYRVSRPDVRRASEPCASEPRVDERRTDGPRDGRRTTDGRASSVSCGDWRCFSSIIRPAENGSVAKAFQPDGVVGCRSGARATASSDRGDGHRADGRASSVSSAGGRTFVPPFGRAAAEDVHGGAVDWENWTKSTGATAHQVTLFLDEGWRVGDIPAYVALCLFVEILVIIGDLVPGGPEGGRFSGDLSDWSKRSWTGMGYSWTCQLCEKYGANLRDLEAATTNKKFFYYMNGWRGNEFPWADVDTLTLNLANLLFEGSAFRRRWTIDDERPQSNGACDVGEGKGRGKRKRDGGVMPVEEGLMR